MDLNESLKAISEELVKYKNIETFLGQDFERPIKSLKDGYPEYTANLIGKILESVLKKIWINNKIKGDPTHKTLNDLINVCSRFINKRIVHDYIIDIQRTRNRASHDGGVVSENDAIESLRKLLVVLDWFQSISTVNNIKESSVLNENIQKKVSFINEFYNVLRYDVKKIYEVTANTAYVLYERRIGTKYDYVEVFFSDNISELLEIFLREENGLFKTSYPKKVRYVIVNDEQSHDQIKKVIEGSEICSFESFFGNFLNYGNYCNNVLERLKSLKEIERNIRLSADILSFDNSIQDFSVEETNDVSAIIEKIAERGFGNFFIISEAGGGKTNLCRSIFKKLSFSSKGPYTIYLDLGLMRRGESLENFITRQLRDYVKLDDKEIFDVIYFLNKSGYIITLLDGLDELFTNIDLNSILDIFSEISKLFSEESRIVITSRVSLFMSSRYIRELLNKNALVSERLKFGLTSVGIDPLQLPNFKVIKLENIHLNSSECSIKHKKIYREIFKKCKASATCSPLVYSLIGSLKNDDVIKTFESNKKTFRETQLIYKYILDEFPNNNKDDFFDDFINYFYESYQEEKNVFNLIELYVALGNELFPDKIITYDNFKLKKIFKYVDQTHIKFKHKCFYEFCFAYGYIKNRILFSQKQRITGKIRDFINEIASQPTYFGIHPKSSSQNLIIPKGYYIVGDGDKSLIKYNDKTLLFDQETVTVKQYLEFLKEIKNKNISEFEHPLQPSDWDHNPNFEKLKIKDYYSNSHYFDYPAICIGFYSAFAYAKFYHKRLPTSFEWECASRGFYGNLFSWGDHYESKIANSADYWSGKIIIDYEEWKKIFDSNEMRIGTPLPKKLFPKNISPFGLINTCGNVWEITSTIDADKKRVVICGGSFDNPFRAIKSSSKGISTIDDQSNAVGFRCCKELEI